MILADGARMNPKPLIERAFELARGGACHSMRDIEQALSREGYVRADVHSHLGGQSLQKQLTALMRGEP